MNTEGIDKRNKEAIAQNEAEKKSEDGKEEEPQSKVEILIATTEPLLQKLEDNTDYMILLPQTHDHELDKLFNHIREEYCPDFKERNIRLLAVTIGNQTALADIPTCKLVEELSGREGVEEVWLGPEDHARLNVYERHGASTTLPPASQIDGPTRILIVID